MYTIYMIYPHTNVLYVADMSAYVSVQCACIVNMEMNNNFTMYRINIDCMYITVCII